MARFLARMVNKFSAGLSSGGHYFPLASRSAVRVGRVSSSRKSSRPTGLFWPEEFSRARAKRRGWKLVKSLRSYVVDDDPIGGEGDSPGAYVADLIERAEGGRENSREISRPRYSPSTFFRSAFCRSVACVFPREPHFIIARVSSAIGNNVGVL